MSSRLTHGQPARVVRPGKREHGWLGRYLQASTAAPGYVEVATDKHDKQALPVSPNSTTNKPARA